VDRTRVARGDSKSSKHRRRGGCWRQHQFHLRMAKRTRGTKQERLKTCKHSVFSFLLKWKNDALLQQWAFSTRQKATSICKLIWWARLFVFCGDMMARASVLLDARTCMTWKEGMVSFGPHSLQPKTHKNEAPKMMLGAGSLVAIRRHYRNESTRTLIL
jgi:hypothetical protein